MNPCCDLTLKTANQSSRMTLPLTMMDNDIKFGNKMFGYLEDTIWTKFTDISNLCCDLDLEHSKPFFPQDTLAYDNVPLDQVCLPKTQQFIGNSRKSHILII